MKILVISDTHGYLPKIEEEFDLLLHGGDVCPARNHYYEFQKEWLENEFVEWVNSLPFRDANSKMVMVPGNHDFYFERVNRSGLKKLEDATDGRLKVLRHKSYDFEYPVSDGIDALRIFGTPYCCIFGNWAFMISDEKLQEKFSEIPEDTDILISHDSPTTNLLGAIMEGPRADLTTGNKILAEHIKRVKPKMFFSGHFHSGNHDFKEIDGTYMANVSYVDERYIPNNKILAIDYDEENRKINYWENIKLNF